MREKSKKLILVAAALAAAICGAVRFFQIITLTDFETGFFYRGSELGGALGYILLGVCSIMLVLLAFVGRKRGDSAYFVSSDGMGENATRWLGLSEMVGGLIIGMGLLNNPDTASAIIIGIIGAVFIVSGAALLAHIIPPKSTGHMKLIPALCLFFRAAAAFNGDLLVRNHAESLIILLSYLLFSAFTASIARFYARVETKNTRIVEISLALLTFLFSMTHLGSDLLTMVYGNASAATFVSPNPDIAAAGIISATFLAVLFFTKKKKDIDPIVLPD